MTNFEKLVRWDADYYKSLTEDDCIVCLTEREVYLVGQIIEVIKWSKTRWIGDLLGLDFDLIASNLEYKLAERMTCQNIGDLLQKLNQLAPKIEYIFNETTINEGGAPATPDTLPYDVHSPEEYAEEFSIATDGCDTPDKDELYAGIRQFVNYVNQVNIDALQNIAQAGNLPEQAQRLISGTPIIGLLPFDEAVDYASFLMNELLEEYEATVDETLLETITCDLFCIAVSSDCNFRLSDAINYYGHKIGAATVVDLTTSLANFVNFVLTGTWSGEQYFYLMTTFQFIAVAVSDEFFNVNGMDKYLLQVAAGMNSPDNDWALLCDACPPLYRIWKHDFSYGMGNFEFGIAPGGSDCPGTSLGTLDGARVKGVHCGAQNGIAIELPFAPEWRLRGHKLYLERRNGITNGTYDYEQMVLIRSAGNITIQSGGFRENGVIERCNFMASAPFYRDGATQLNINLGVFYDADPLSEIFLDKVELLFELNHAPLDAVVTEDGNICD